MTVAGFGRKMGSWQTIGNEYKTTYSSLNYEACKLSLNVLVINKKTSIKM